MFEGLNADVDKTEVTYWFIELTRAEAEKRFADERIFGIDRFGGDFLLETLEDFDRAEMYAVEYMSDTQRRDALLDMGEEYRKLTGLNLVICPECGAITPYPITDERVICNKCNLEGSTSDFPDLMS